MVVNRVEGLAKASLFLLFLVNLSAFLTYGLALYLIAGDYFRMSLSSMAYVLSIPIAFFYASRRIVESLSRIEDLELIRALGLTIKIQIGYLIGTALIYFLKEDIDSSRLALFIFGVLMAPLNMGAFALIPKVLAWHFFPNHIKSKAVIICGQDIEESQKHYMRRCRRLGIDFIGHFADRPLEAVDLPHLGPVETIQERHRDTGGFDSILACSIDFKEPRYQKLVRFCQEQGIRIQTHARFTNAFQEPVKVIHDEDFNFIAFPDEPLEDPLQKAIKRTFDVALSLPVCLGLLLPLVAVVAVAQRLQAPGPLFYRQPRYGMRRRVFVILKFRSMYHQAAAVTDEEQARQATSDDPRIYPLGRFLRKYSLDEFPQFWNVLKGDMSIVGPRPHPIKLDESLEKEVASYRARHHIKPGITGLAQVDGFRGEITTPEELEERIRRDLRYVYTWSLLLDFTIIAKTILHLVDPPDRAY